MEARKQRSNGRIGLIFGGVALGMIGVAFASVPAYRLFCQITGYGGTPQVASETEAGPAVIDRPITVRFDASLNGGMPWQFAPAQKDLTVNLGEQSLAHYTATNLSDETVTGTATFNVTPLKAAQYFNKIDCFCFTEQTLAPGQTVDMPVTFFVDPKLAEDENVNEVTTITLSYTFFRKQAVDGGDS